MRDVYDSHIYIRKRSASRRWLSTSTKSILPVCTQQGGCLRRSGGVIRMARRRDRRYPYGYRRKLLYPTIDVSAREISDLVRLKKQQFRKWLIEEERKEAEIM